jgi:hypothetical protein
MVDASSEAPSDYQLIGPSEDGNLNDLLAALNVKQSRQRLQALIAEWLGMENLVVLTGAGTSVTSGGKTMDNLEHAVAGNEPHIFVLDINGEYGRAFLGAN